jgi:hypothetical protein
VGGLAAVKGFTCCDFVIVTGVEDEHKQRKKKKRPAPSAAEGIRTATVGGKVKDESVFFTACFQALLLVEEWNCWIRDNKSQASGGSAAAWIIFFRKISRADDFLLFF